MPSKNQFIPLIKADQISTFVDYVANYEKQAYLTLSDTDLPFDLGKHTQHGYVGRQVVHRMFDSLATSMDELAFTKMAMVCCKINALKLTRGKQLTGTVRNGLLQLRQQYRIDSTDTDLVMEQGPGYAWFYFKRDAGPRVGTDIIGVLTLLYAVRQLTGRQWIPEVVTLKGSASSKLEKALDSKSIEFKLNHNNPGVYISDLLLESEIPQPTSEGLQLDYHELHTFKYSLKKLLEPYISGSAPTVNQAATYANMSVRTLQRRLSAEGFSYSDVIFELLDEMACDALIHSDESITELSHRLGYSHGSHMIRAFKKRFELTPKQFRDKYRTITN